MISLVKTVNVTEGGFINQQMGVFRVGDALQLISGNCPEGKWSGAKYPPAVGDRVTVNFNDFGAGTVLGHFVQDGWLGLEVKVDRQPEWHLKQNGVQPSIKVFGAEVNY